VNAINLQYSTDMAAAVRKMTNGDISAIIGR